MIYEYRTNFKMNEHRQKFIDKTVKNGKFYLNEDGTPNQEMLEKFDELARANNCRFMKASNFSFGMNALWKHLAPLARTMHALGYDVAVEERHHNQKADVAGTAKTIGRILIDAYPNKGRLNFGNCERKIDPDEITVVSTRVGHVPGTHTVVFDSPVDTLEFSHKVRDRSVFAAGAVDSAYWLREQEPGAYDISDRLK